MKKTGKLGLEDKAWLWQTLPAYAAEIDAAVYSIRHDHDGIIVKFVFRGQDEFEPTQHIFIVELCYVDDVLDILPRWLKFKHDVRIEECKRRRVRALLRLNDYDGYYLNQ